jgi:uncharacterized protein (DUF2236 family)
MATATNGWLGGTRPPQVAGPLAAVAPAGLPILRDSVNVLLRRVFGTRRSETIGDADPGLCGPASPSWRIISEPAAIAGGLRALLLQTLHPLAMAGVAQHSQYQDDPLARLQSTSAWVTAATFGTTAEVLEAAHVVRRAHRRVHGIAPDGRAYSAGDPHLLVWVSVALTSSFLAADRLWAPQPVTPIDADRFVAEQSRLAALLDERVQLRDLRRAADAGPLLRAGAIELPLLAELPSTVAELLAVLDSYAPDLVAGTQARDAVRFLRWPPVPGPLRAAYVSVFAGAAGSLPRWQRGMLELPTSRIVAAAAVANTATVLTALRSAVGRSPVYDAATRRTNAA